MNSAMIATILQLTSSDTVVLAENRRRTRLLPMCRIVGAFLLLSLLLWLGPCAWIFDNGERTVFINAVDHVKGAECTRFGHIHFNIKAGTIVSQISILSNKTENAFYSMDILVKSTGTNSVVPDSIAFTMSINNDKGETRVIRTAPEWSPPHIYKSANGEFESWSQGYTIFEDLADLPDGQVSLEWAMAYHEENGTSKRLLFSVPLRKIQVVRPFSIVDVDHAESPGYFWKWPDIHPQHTEAIRSLLCFSCCESGPSTSNTNKLIVNSKATP